jgi:putative ABC transport system permease protein
MNNLWRDIRYAVRTLRKNPGFTAVVVLTLGLGIGANTAIFSVTNAVLLKPPPFQDPDQLVQLWETQSDVPLAPVSSGDYLDWQAQNSTLAGTSMYGFVQNSNLSNKVSSEPAATVMVQGNFFKTLGAEPAAGRTFLAGEDQPGQNHVAVLSHRFWQQHMAGRSDALGQEVELDSMKYVIVGIMPLGFNFPAGTDVWIPFDMSATAMSKHGQHQYKVVSRLRSGVSVQNAETDLKAISLRLQQEFPDTNYKIGVAVLPFREQLIKSARPLLLMLMSAVFVVLLIACANVTNLMLARATSRSREVAIRTALGSSNPRLIRQLLAESILLSLLGGIFGILLANWSLSIFEKAVAQIDPHQNPIALDKTGLGLTFLVALVIGIIFGMVPVYHGLRVNMVTELKAGAVNLFGSDKRKLICYGLIVGQIAMSLALLMNAGLLIRSLKHLREVDIGVSSSQLSTVKLLLPAQTYQTPEQAKAFYDGLLQDLGKDPRINAATVARELPTDGGNNGYVTLPGHTTDKVLVEWNSVTTNYFKVMNIPFLKGRSFQDQDSAEALAVLHASVKSGNEAHPYDGPPTLVAIINETMSQKLWPQGDAVGNIFNLGGGVPVTVIGIVGDVKEFGIVGQVIPQAYFPLEWAFYRPGRPMNLIVKQNTSSSRVIESVKVAVRKADPTLALFSVHSMQDVIDNSTTTVRSQTTLLTVFAILALVLVAVGIYGVLSYLMTQRTREFSIRMAVGAQRRDLIKLIGGEMAAVLSIGLVLGMAGAYALSRSLASMLYGLSSDDPATFGFAAIVVATTVLLAGLVPAIRTTRVDPATMLRQE